MRRGASQREEKKEACHKKYFGATPGSFPDWRGYNSGIGTDIRIVIEFDISLASNRPERVGVVPFENWDYVNAWDMKGDALNLGAKDYRF